MASLTDKLSENGRKKVIFVRQEDGAGPHTDKTYLRFMEEEFRRKDWINFRQPSHSPVFNTNDTFFHDDVKSSYSGARIVIWRENDAGGEELFEAVKKVWNDKKKLTGVGKIVCWASPNRLRDAQL